MIHRRRNEKWHSVYCLMCHTCYAICLSNNGEMQWTYQGPQQWSQAPSIINLIVLCPERPWGRRCWIIGLGRPRPVDHHARTIIALVVQRGRALPPPLQPKIPLANLRCYQAAVAFVEQHRAVAAIPIRCSRNNIPQHGPKRSIDK